MKIKYFFPERLYVHTSTNTYAYLWKIQIYCSYHKWLEQKQPLNLSLAPHSKVNTPLFFTLIFINIPDIYLELFKEHTGKTLVSDFGSTAKDFPDQRGFPDADFETYIAPSHVASH